MKELIANPSRYEMPKPTRFLVLDDLSSGNSNTKGQLEQLRSLIDAKAGAFLVDTSTLATRLKRKYEMRAQELKTPPLDLLIAVGDAGERVTYLLNLGVPVIKVNPTRKVGPEGLPVVVSKTGVPLIEEARLALTNSNIDPSQVKSVGAVDDVVFFGTTLKGVADVCSSLMPSSVFTALILVSTPALARDLPKVDLISGITLTTNRADANGTNVICARDFIADDALRISETISIPFMNEENWMQSWFGPQYEQAVSICRILKESL